jgi:hypothetical protein
MRPYLIKLKKFFNLLFKDKQMNLPQEIVIKILVEFHGGFSFRNGKLMAKIAKDDMRMQLVFPHHTLSHRNISIDLMIAPRKYYRLQFYYYYCDCSEKFESAKTISFFENNTCTPLFY